MALLILALLQRIFLMSSLMLLLVWLIFFMVLIKLLPILGTISGKTVKLMVLAQKVKMSTVESIARPRRNGERRRAPTASISKESPAITGVVEMVIRRPI